MTSPARALRQVAHRALAAGRSTIERRVTSPRPPLDPPESVRALGAVAPGERFITGNGIAAHCRFVVNYERLVVNEEVENDWWFCKVDYLEYFFRELRPDAPFVLFSHNGDRPVSGRFRRRLRDRRLVAWFAANAATVHPKLLALPLGVANAFWPHGDVEALAAAQRARAPKTRLFDVSFDVATNPRERRRCLELTGLERDEPLPFPRYLERLASSHFCLAPRGNGIDTHRAWEALYVGTVPVVTRSVLTDQHQDLPMLVLDHWSEFRSIDFSPELYRRTWGDWDPDTIRLDRYLERVARAVEALRS